MESINTHFQCVFKVERVERLERVFLHPPPAFGFFFCKKNHFSMIGLENHPLQPLHPLHLENTLKMSVC